MIDLLKDAGIFQAFFVAFALLIGIVLLGVIIALFRKILQGTSRSHLTNPESSPEPAVSAETARDERDRFLKTFENIRLRRELRDVLRDGRTLSIGLIERPDAIKHRWDQNVQRPSLGQESANISQIARLFDSFAGTMLILGEPGAGKSTALRLLARQLLERIGDDVEQFPAIFDLARWPMGKEVALEEWLVSELKYHHGVDAAISRYWISNYQLVPLFDGFDEIRDDEDKNRCIIAFNAYYKNGRNWVVCLRQADYLALSSWFEHGNAAMLTPLEDSEIERHLKSLDHDDLLQIIRSDPDLQELARSPLWLNVMIETGDEMKSPSASFTIKQKRSALLDAYLRRVLLGHRKPPERWSVRGMLNWLRWLASQSLRHSAASFSPDSIQPDWLPSVVAQDHYQDWLRRGGKVCLWLAMSLAAWCIGICIFGLHEGSFFGMTFALVFGVLFGLFVRIEPDAMTITPVTTIEWRWREMFSAFWNQFGGPTKVKLIRDIVIWVAATWFFARILRLYGVIVFWTFTGLLFSITDWFRDSFVGNARNLASRQPGDSIRQSGYNWALVSLVVGLFGGLLFFMVGGAAFALVGALLFFVAGGAEIGMEYGGSAFLKHWLLRFILWKHNSAPRPLQLIPWLDEAERHIILKRSEKSSYMFRHRILAEHIANLDDRFIVEFNEKSPESSMLEQELTAPAERSDARSNQPVVVLFLAANPTSTTRLRLDEEVRAIDKALRQANYRDQFDLRQHWAVRASDLQELLLRHQPHIVHFSGHGSDSGQLIFEDDSGNAHPVQTDALSRLFAILTDNLRCVVLNACYSEPQAQAIAAHIDCVIGVPGEIGDTASLNFAASFYQALAYGRDVQTAFDLGCNQIDLQALDEPNKPRLLAQRTDPRQVSFAFTPKTSAAQPKPSTMSLSPSQRLHLETQRSELQKRHATLTRRIDALDTDIGRELDSERRLVLDERRHDLTAEREQVIAALADIERQLGLG